MVARSEMKQIYDRWQNGELLELETGETYLAQLHRKLQDSRIKALETRKRALMIEIGVLKDEAVTRAAIVQNLNADKGVLLADKKRLEQDIARYQSEIVKLMGAANEPAKVSELTKGD